MSKIKNLAQFLGTHSYIERDRALEDKFWALTDLQFEDSLKVIRRSRETESYSIWAVSKACRRQKSRA